MKLLPTLSFFFGTAALIVSHSAGAETTFRLGLASLPNGNGNPYFSSARTSWYTHRAIFDTLTHLGSNLAIQPGIATSWEHTDDLTWVVKLRDGVKFSNGEVLNAEAVIASYSYLKTDEGMRESLARDVADIVIMEAIDPLTIRFVTDVPIPEFSRLMAIIPIVAPAHWQKVGRTSFAFDPVGSGPFAVTEWNATQILLDAQTDSWRPPKVDKLEILTLPETSARVAALMTDRVDVASEIGPDDVFKVEDAGFRTYQRPATATQVITFNTMVDSPLKDVRVRRALNYAVNKDAIALAIMDGRTKVVDQMTAGINPERDNSLEPYSYDPEKARALLADAGYPDGFSFIFEFSFGTGGTHMATMYQQVASDLAKIGVDMEVRPLPFSQYVRGVLQGEWGGQAFGFEYEVLPTGGSMRPFRLHSCAWPYPWYCDETIQPSIEDAKHNINPGERIAAVRKVLRHYRDQAVSLMLVENMGLDGINPRVRGYNQEGGIIPFHAITLDD